jgi:hypothetical protein
MTTIYITGSASIVAKSSSESQRKYSPGHVELFAAVITFRITPATGYRILDVKVDDLSVGAVAEYTFESVTANRTIEAYFDTLARKPMPWVLLLLDD